MNILQIYILSLQPIQVYIYIYNSMDAKENIPFKAINEHILGACSLALYYKKSSMCYFSTVLFFFCFSILISKIF